VITLALPAIAAQPADLHVSTAVGNNLYAASAFAHGMRHGYEEGFHDADRDLHLSAFRLEDLTLSKVPKTVGYQASFGSKESFRKGYETGYRLGYADSLKGIAFRMIAPRMNVTAIPDRDFDRGVQYGFNSPGNACSGPPAYCAGVQAGRTLATATESTTQVASAK
jgi:hypothetical protein